MSYFDFILTVQSH